jgi:acetoin utilization deacetylase AcuC-like enzyme
VVEGSLDRLAIRRIGFPWSPELVERSRRSVGATIAACRAALEDGVSVNLAGGTHHAGVRHGEGYCVFNDAAVAVRALQAEALVERVIVIDCDVHQGNGTAEIFAGDANVFTFDVYGEHNYPFTKTEPDLGIALPDDTGDTDYLAALTAHLGPTLDSGDWDLAIYVSGADPFVDDKLGRLSLTKTGLSKRDEVVVRACRDRAIPIAVTMAGGYAEEADDIVDIHLTTVRIAAQAMEMERV